MGSLLVDAPRGVGASKAATPLTWVRARELAGFLVALLRAVASVAAVALLLGLSPVFGRGTLGAAFPAVFARVVAGAFNDLSPLDALRATGPPSADGKQS